MKEFAGVDTDVMERILTEVALGRPPARADSNEEAALRLRLARECEEIRAHGGGIDVPHEIPGATK